MRNLLPAKPISYLLLAPSILVLLSLVLYPMAFALVNSFYFWNLQTSPQPMFFNGLENYRMVFQFFASTGIYWNYIAATAVVAMLPPMLIFLALSRYVVRGLTFGAVKG